MEVDRAQQLANAMEKKARNFDKVSTITSLGEVVQAECEERTGVRGRATVTSIETMSCCQSSAQRY